MARVIAVTNQKGGTGKTTTTINLGTYLASAGKYVLILDLDPQGNATSGFGITRECIRGGAYEIIAKKVSMKDAIISTSVERLSIIPATESLAAANVEFINVPDRENLLKNVLLEIRNNFDYVLIDCPPSLGILTIISLVASDQALIPVQSEYYALEGLGQLLNTINMVQQNLNKELKIMGAVLTMYDKRTRLSMQIVKEMNRHFPNKVFESIIPRNVRLSEAPSHGKPIKQYEPWSKGARAYENLAKEVLALESENTQNF